jgi:hypothetical protein
MRENVGRIDRIVRTVIGARLLAGGLWGGLKGHRTAVFGVALGGFLLESALTRVCPVSTLFGFDTRSTEERIRDFRGDVNEQSERIAHDYAPPIAPSIANDDKQRPAAR